MLLPVGGRFDEPPFDEVCTLLYVSRTNGLEGDREDGPIGYGDLVVVGFMKGKTNYRGIVLFDALMTFPANVLQRGQKYRFISNGLPVFGAGNFHGTMLLETIHPHITLRDRLLSLLGF